MEIIKGSFSDFIEYWIGADWAMPQFGEFMQKDKAEFWYAKCNDTVVGRIYFFKKLSDSDAADGKTRGYICNLHVLKEYRKQGIGTSLINSIKERAKELHFSHLTIGVSEDELSNVRLYSALGFQNKTKMSYYDLICVDSDEKPIQNDGFTILSCALK